MSEPSRQRRSERRSTPPPFRLTARDREVIQAVYQYRVISQEQLRRLCFAACDPSVAKRRLYKLYHHGLLDRRFLPVVGGIVHSPILYVLDRAGADVLRKKYPTIRWTSDHKKIGYTFIDHTLAINEVRLAVTLACQTVKGIQVTTWVGESAMKQDTAWGRVPTTTGKHRRVPAIPDSLFTLDIGSQKAFFALELDRGTMELKRFKRKITAYVEYLESGAYQQHYGTKSLRILTVTQSAERLAHLKRVTEAAGGKRRFWFTTLAEITPETVLHAPIWQVAGQTERTCIVSNKETGSPLVWQPHLWPLLLAASCVDPGNLKRVPVVNAGRTASIV